MKSPMNDPFSESVMQLKNVFRRLDCGQEIFNRLSNPDRVLYKQLEIKLDNGKMASFNAWRSQHCNVLGPYKGGIRFHPLVNESEVKALSTWMTWKTSLMGLPYGGGKGGVAVDTKKLSLSEKERLSREYIRSFYEYLGPWNDIPAPDVGTGSREMAWMSDEYRNIMLRNDRILKINPLAVVTGKPVVLSGSLGREEATGRGGAEVLQRLLELDLISEDRTLAIQGFGNVGYWFSKIASEMGWRIIAVSDSSGGVYDYQGLNVDMLYEHKMKMGSVTGYEYGEKISNDKLLELDVNVLVPAALEGVITDKNAKDIRAGIVLELANGPVTVAGEKILLKKGIMIIPDILANAGGVTVSWMEWVQNLNGDMWTIEQVNQKLSVMMRNATDRVFEKYDNLKISWREASYLVSVQRVVDAIILNNS